MQFFCKPIFNHPDISQNSHNFPLPPEYIISKLLYINPLRPNYSSHHQHDDSSCDSSTPRVYRIRRREAHRAGERGSPGKLRPKQSLPSQSDQRRRLIGLPIRSVRSCQIRNSHVYNNLPTPRHPVQHL
ncbi:hypothetical protein B9Z55_017137 [Caenorhabditis nigoni]|uniref:Uncharacterized protein n=1 Tax=Caenorhabditis nigoni TaxID=1611254 RepID=A0A2G5T838_9PELO|nr:hypothetical protein B9Z55_017137 [Caenorhabditis nigoni]